ncbi:hypothetical protein CALVIDRAFT_567323 [Calocera viscosa TUFC12733]|uniref:Stealth protein CR3 conserved region 3 domain-containing protein n=1 Tax=Calocera viscosa (strain TUFC12733) TaxID=1330018 RepID=A0A167IAF2_CALVF|nr:hypothetical protein CALVIDRAFT_567323 [Calocera viscosa TUFC12733]
MHPLLRRPLLNLILPCLTLTLLLLTAYNLRPDRASGFLVASPPPTSGPAVCPNPDTEREILWPPRPKTKEEQLRYLLLRSSQPPPPGPRIRPVPTLPAACIDPWLASGLPCSQKAPPLPADLLWTWVNGTDPLQLSSAAAASLAAGNTPAKSRTQAASKLYRENGELLYSVRSAMASVGSWARRAHVVVGDYNLTDCAPESWRDENSTLHTFSPPETRMAQLPQWLRPLQAGGEWVDGGVQLDVVSHWEVGVREKVFNSFAIEAALGQVEGLADNFVYLNDDYFLLLPLSASSFFTRAYGLVFRFQSDLLVRGSSTSRASSTGEWAALEWSNNMLNQRFGERQRPYVIHVAKGMSLPLVEELQLSFPAQFEDTRTHVFRSNQDAYLGFLFPHFVIERHREVLLWSFIVARLGGEGDEWGEGQMEEAWRVLGGGEGEEYYKDLEVRRGERETLVEGRVKRVLGEEPKSTVYKFSSHDGYPYHLPSRAAKSFPTFPAPGHSPTGTTPPACTLEFELCLGTEGEPSVLASQVFKRVAFELPQCGDCLITALVGKSGVKGLNAFLPLPQAEPAGQEQELPEGLTPVLPLSSTWQSADFSLSTIFPHPRSSLRAFTLALLARYTYTIADTPVRFASLRTPLSSKQVLAALDKDRALAMACVNDDIVSREGDVRKVMGEWMGKRWAGRRDWERGGWW